MFSTSELSIQLLWSYLHPLLLGGLPLKDIQRNVRILSSHLLSSSKTIEASLPLTARMLWLPLVEPTNDGLIIFRDILKYFATSSMFTSLLKPQGNEAQWDRYTYTSALADVLHCGLATGIADPLPALENADVDIDMTDLYGNTALIWAAAVGNITLVNYLARRVVPNIVCRNPDEHSITCITKVVAATPEGSTVASNTVSTAAGGQAAGAGTQVEAPGTAIRSPAVRDVPEHADAPTCCLAIAPADGPALTPVVGRRTVAALDKQNLAGETALHVGIRCRQMDVVKALLRAGANVNLSDRWGRTPLLMCAELGDKAAVQLLLHAGANAGMARHDGETPLMVALAAGHMDVVRVLLAVSPLTVRTPSGETALHYAVRFRRCGALVPLVQARADVNTATDSGETALHLAVAIKNPDAVQKLLDLRADIHRTSVMGLSPVANAARDNNVPMVKLLMANKADVSRVLPVAARLVKPATAQVLLDCKANIEATDNSGNTALMQAVRTGNAAFVEMLVAKGADVNTRNHMRETPLLVAVPSRREEIIKMLLSARADVDAMSRMSTNPLLMAVSTRALNIARLMLSSKASVETEDPLTPLIAALRTGDLDMSKLLLRAKANVNHYDLNYAPPMCIAARSNSVHVMQLLVAANGDLSVAGPGGETPLMTAATMDHAHIHTPALLMGFILAHADGSKLLRAAIEDGRVDVMRVLLVAGVDAEACDENGRSPMLRAVMTGKVKCVVALLEGGVSPDACGKVCGTQEHVTPLHYAVENGLTAVAEALVEGGAKVFSSPGFTNVIAVAEAKGDKAMADVLRTTQDRSRSNPREKRRKRNCAFADFGVKVLTEVFEYLLSRNVDGQ